MGEDGGLRVGSNNGMQKRAARMTPLGGLKPVPESRFNDWVECGKQGREKV